MYYQRTMAETLTASPAKADISSRLIEELRELYYGHFDNFWFISLLEKNAYNTADLRYIRNMLDIQSVYNTEAAVFSDGIKALEELIITSKRYLLPSLRDELRISGFYKNRSADNQIIMKSLFSYTFPHNLERLEELTAELKNIINE